MEVFMISIQLFAAVYGDNMDTIKPPIYEALQMDSMEACHERGDNLTMITQVTHDGLSAFYYKCIQRQGV